MKKPPVNVNIFEDLIDELKEENLIEETVIRTDKAQKKAAEPAVVEAFVVETAPPAKPKAAEPAPDETEKSDEVDFYRQRAIEEVTFLQMVESAFAGIEREQIKIVPSLYDDLVVKKVLHSYLQISPKATSAERSPAEFALLQATENWHSTLAERDRRIMTAHLRRYCETSRPPLSMPALIALARFYRNSPYSEAVRCKFDLMLTRIFSQEAYDHRREINFSREELTGYVKELYAEWSSVPMYSTDEDDEGLRQTIAQFEEFVREANDVADFDELINTNFFNRLRQFKESTNEDFYAPEVVAAAIELNVHIGNRYVELLEREKEREGIERIESKYALLNDSTISDVTSKTMSLVELLSERNAPPEPEAEAEEFEEPPPPKIAAPTEAEKEAVKNTNIAKWILMGIAGLIVVVAVYYFIGSASPPSDSVAPPLNIENSMLKNYLQSARLQDGTLNGVVQPAIWDKLDAAAKKQTLKTMLTFGGEKGYRQIELFDQKGKKIAVADDGGIYVIE